MGLLLGREVGWVGLGWVRGFLSVRFVCYVRLLRSAFCACLYIYIYIYIYAMLCYIYTRRGWAGLGWVCISLSLSQSTPTSVRQIVLLPGTVIFNFTVFGLGWGAFLSMLCE